MCAFYIYAGAGLLLGVSATSLLWGGLVVPFVAVGLISRFWPLLRTLFMNWSERLQQRWKETVSGPGVIPEINSARDALIVQSPADV